MKNLFKNDTLFDSCISLAIIMLLFDFVTPINGTVKFVVSLILVVGIFLAAIIRIVSAVRHSKPTTIK